MSNFALSRSLESTHLIPQPADLRLSPPQSYLFVQDFLVLTCALLYLLCYLFYALRTVRDRRLAGPVEFLSATMAYEIFYAVATTTTAEKDQGGGVLERAGFFAWFVFDAAFVAVAVRFGYPEGKRWRVAARTVGLTVVLLGVYWGVAWWWPDEREQVTGFWTGVGLQFVINWGSLVILWGEGGTRGQSLEIWATRFIGCIFAFAVFIWRYLNVPQNWSYVGSKESVWLMGLTLLPELVFPFVYLKVHKQQEARQELEKMRKKRS